MQRTLGVCYYPEHWPPSDWELDASAMRALGISTVRIGEFAWQQIEPAPDKFNWQWLDRAIDTLGEAGLSIIMCTPTATPPRWMAERWPDMYAVDANGNRRIFGSRRHYCFSHSGYRDESRRITRLVAERYGASKFISGWQTDNEYGCHDTTRSYSPAALEQFRLWLKQKYGTVAAMNDAWGNVFWSMNYDSFNQVDLPCFTVTEANPAHRLDFYRFSSDQVISFNREQTAILRAHTSQPLIHNYMGRITDFDHFEIGKDLDIASWDSYPLGFLEDRADADEARKLAYSRQGDPDFQAFHHDLYRAVGKGRFWIMEQQPGPVNWAPYNPAPLPGMVRLWSWEAFAHGAETVSYFRWRQLPFGQEQMHAGLLRPDRSQTPACAEIEQLAAELLEFPETAAEPAPVALMFDYESCWAWEIQPQGASFQYFTLVLDCYRALRSLGLSVDIVSPDHEIDDYELLVMPGLMTVTSDLARRLADFSGALLAGPRSNSKTEHFHTRLSKAASAELIPGISGKVLQVESLRPGAGRKLADGGAVKNWIESVETSAALIESTSEGQPVLIGSDTRQYLAAWPEEAALRRMLKRLCICRSIATLDLPDGLRIRDTPTHRFVFNHTTEDQDYEGETLPPATVKWFERST